MLLFEPFLGLISKSRMFSSRAEQTLDKAGSSGIFSRNMAANGDRSNSKCSPVRNGSVSNRGLRRRDSHGPGYGEHGRANG